jgi:predicted ATPase
MRLKSFQVQDYRSIASTFEIGSLSNLTVVGPNNEGKSNLVTALVTALRLLEDHSREARLGSLRVLGRRVSGAYEWQRDYPLRMQDRESADSVFKLKFILDEDDQQEFLHAVGSSINDNLPITVKIGRDNRPRFEVNKPGKGYSSLNGKSAQIAAFVGSKLSINYIPAVRTARDSAKSVEGLVSSALRQVEKTPEYVTAMQTIQTLQRPVLEQIEDRLKETLETFVPSVTNVQMHVREGRSEALRSIEISIDDGQLTPLSSKGDGIISLVGMALLSKIDTLAQKGESLVLVIEEPESHLHPRAINAIRATLDNLASNIQVIITTHSPNLVNRTDIRSNIIVESNKARVANNISEIRDVLGVRVTDNLTNARMNIICEGLTDCKALTKIFSDLDSDLCELFSNGEIAFSNLRGAGNLSYLVNSVQNAVCEPFCMLDDDNAGRTAFSAAKSDGLLTDDDVIFTTRVGKSDSEMEDLISDISISEVLGTKFGVEIGGITIPKGIRPQKFSDRIAFVFKASGKPWNEEVENRVKIEICKKCFDDGIRSISDDSLPIFRQLCL